MAIPTLQCPSDIVSGLGTLVSGLRLAKTNYLGIFSGLDDLDAYNNSNPKQCARLLLRQGDFVRRHQGWRQQHDGRCRVPKRNRRKRRRGYFWTQRAGCQTLFVKLGPNSTAPDDFIGYDSHFCPTDNSRNDPSANLPCTQGADDSNYASPRSRHAGGVNVVFCDGSVHFIQDGINSATWQNLGWIDDGNVINADF